MWAEINIESDLIIRPLNGRTEVIVKSVIGSWKGNFNFEILDTSENRMIITEAVNKAPSRKYIKNWICTLIKGGEK